MLELLHASKALVHPASYSQGVWDGEGAYNAINRAA